MTEANEKLSSYAFNLYGDDAKLYNGVHDMEAQLSSQRAEIERLRGDHAPIMKYEARECATLGTAFRDIYDSSGNLFARELGKYHADLFCANPWAFGNTHAPATKLRTWMIELELKNMPDALKQAAAVRVRKQG